MFNCQISFLPAQHSLSSDQHRLDILHLLILPLSSLRSNVCFLCSRTAVFHSFLLSLLSISITSPARFQFTFLFFVCVWCVWNALRLRNHVEPVSYPLLHYLVIGIRLNSMEFQSMSLKIKLFPLTIATPTTAILLLFS